MNGPEYNNRFGAGVNGSMIHPFVLIMTIIAAILILVLPRKYAVVPLLVTIFLTPFGQQVYFAGARLVDPRLVSLCGWVRIILTKFSSRSKFVSGGFSSVDKIFVLWAFLRAL